MLCLLTQESLLFFGDLMTSQRSEKGGIVEFVINSNLKDAIIVQLVVDVFLSWIITVPGSIIALVSKTERISCY
jgi:hypothetical protein